MYIRRREDLEVFFSLFSKSRSPSWFCVVDFSICTWKQEGGGFRLRCLWPTKTDFLRNHIKQAEVDIMLLFIWWLFLAIWTLCECWMGLVIIVITYLLKFYWKTQIRRIFSFKKYFINKIIFIYLPSNDELFLVNCLLKYLIQQNLYAVFIDTRLSIPYAWMFQ